MKLLLAIYRALRELGISVKDIIGVGKSLTQEGQTLFKEIKPEILKIIYDQGKLSGKLKNIVTDAARSLRNTNVIQQRKFLTNLRKIQNAVVPQEADVIDIVTRAKIPASGIEKLKTKIQLGKNVLPFKTGEARWILDKAFKEGHFEFRPAEIEMIKGGKGDILELFRSYYGSNAVRNLPAEGSVGSAHKFFKKLNNAVDESGFLKNHPEFNKEAIDWKKTNELTKKYGDRLDDHPFITEKELTKGFAEAKGTFPRLDPENDAFIILDAKGNKMGRYEGRVTIDKITNKGVTQWWDRWDTKNKKLLTDSSKFKFSGAVDDKGKDIITAEGVIEGDIISKEPSLTKGKFARIKQGLSTQIKLNTLPQNKQFAKELVSGKNSEFNTLDKAAKREVLERLEFNIKKTQSDFATPVKPEDLASGGRIGYDKGTLPEPKPEEVYLDKRLEKLQRAKKTILDNPGAFVDKDGKFTGEALIESINNDIAQLRKEYVDIEKIPGHATGGVSNLFRRR